MNSKLTPFQTVMFGGLILVIILSVAVFSMQRNNSNKNQAGEVSMWGTLPEENINEVTKAINEEARNSINVKYTEINPRDFQNILVESIASGNGPDMVLMPDDFFIKQENKLYTIPYENYSQASFKGNFIEASEFMLKPKGIVGLPYMIDPLVMYWNRTTLNQAGISVPPKYWEDFVALSPRISVKDTETLNIKKATLAFGTFNNVENAKEILLNLIIQAGNPIVQINQTEGGVEYDVTLSDRIGYAVAPSVAAINYFTQFSDPAKSVYSWNRSLPLDQEMFLAGDLAFYFGPASEYRKLREKNPNLNFDVSVVPQSSGNQISSTYGKVYFIGIVKNSKRLPSAVDAAGKLTSPTAQKALSNFTGLPSVRRDLFINTPEDSVKQNFNYSALISKYFLDPDGDKSEEIFRNMIESYISGRTALSSAISQAESLLDSLIPKNDSQNN